MLSKLWPNPKPKLSGRVRFQVPNFSGNSVRAFFGQISDWDQDGSGFSGKNFTPIVNYD